MRWRRKSHDDEPVAPLETGNVTLVGPTDRSGGPGSHAGDVVADEKVLDELSVAFADQDTSAHPARHTIAIGGDDDVPDAMYLDEELQRDVSGSEPVFIDDDGSSDAVMPKDATARGIEPRLRQRRIGVRRAANRKRLWWIGIGVVVLLVVLAALALLGSSLFAVQDVTVSGVVYTDPDALQAIVDDLEGTPTLLVDTAEIEAELESIPWVEDARVDTSFPHEATIEIRERTPVAATPGADGLTRVLDDAGRVLDVIEGEPVALVWISGPGTLDVAEGEFAPIGYAAAAALVPKLTPEIRSRVESMLVTADGADLVLVLTSPSGPIEVRFGSAIGENAQIEKLVRLERVLEDTGERTVSVIDVSTSEVTVR